MSDDDVDPAIEARIAAGARDLARLFGACRVFADHFALVDDPATRKRILWVKKHRAELYADALRPAVVESWARCRVAAAGQGALAL